MAATADTTANVWANGDLYVTRITVKGDATTVGTVTFGQNGVALTLLAKHILERKH